MAEESDVTAGVEALSGWPIINGKPAAKVRNGAWEKIGLPNYSAVDIGPASVERFVEDTPEAIDQGLRDCLAVTEKILSEEREAILKNMNTGS